MKLLLAIFSFYSFQLHAAYTTPDYALEGVTKENKKCVLNINLEQKYLTFETPKHTCEFTLDEDDVEEFKMPEGRRVTAKGYFNWFDCKVKLYYDKNGKPYRAKLHSRLTFAMTFYNDQCFFKGE